jgi:DNA-binding GntR family transcriptional regulator
MLKKFDIGRHTKYRGLKLLEEAGLIEVERRFKKNPKVTIKMKWY